MGASHLTRLLANDSEVKGRSRFKLRQINQLLLVRNRSRYKRYIGSGTIENIGKEKWYRQIG